ncbi:hypothetical protein P8C59_008979 [Phyllachora maydis]|uniref:Uncharacterized protein n=1 Tax=Phyllachora maydis TaxID=1825666 RepID=A0AAD9ICI9_9PEZI|nr:hypothetical protein P8C59_008979 [Phyllachora maydis]
MAHHLQDVRTRKRATTIQRKKGKHLGPTSWLWWEPNKVRTGLHDLIIDTQIPESNLSPNGPASTPARNSNPESLLTLAAISLTSRRFHAIVGPFLYHTIPDPGSVARDLLLLRTLRANPHLARRSKRAPRLPMGTGLGLGCPPCTYPPIEEEGMTPARMEDMTRRRNSFGGWL